MAHAEMIRIEDLSKSFMLHLRGGLVLPVLQAVSLTVSGGECVVLQGPSGAGKSTLIRSVYGNYRPQDGRILIRHRGEWRDMVRASPREVLEIRRQTLGYVSQFLRVIPRVTTLEIVAEPLMVEGLQPDAARQVAGDMLERLRIPQRLWGLPPSTFSGGEQQRVNIARVFVGNQPILLLDEPTASLDADNRKTVIELINTTRQRGVAILAIVHDPATREAITTRLHEMRTADMAA